MYFLQITFLYKALSLLLILFLSLNPAKSSDDQVTLENVSGSTLKIEGDSTLHSWDADAEEFSVTLSVGRSWLDSMDEWSSDSVENLKVVVPVDKIESGRSRMNRDLREALKAEDYPEIIFDWKEITLDENSASEYRILNVTGTLKVAGEKREIEFTAEAALDNGTINVKGSYELNMEYYGIDPPRALLGTLRTDKKVVIMFGLKLEERDN